MENQIAIEPITPIHHNSGEIILRKAVIDSMSDYYYSYPKLKLFPNIASAP